MVKAVTCSELKTTAYEDFTPTDFEKAKLTYMAVPDMAAAITAARDAGICEGEIAMCAALGSAGINRLKTIGRKPKA